MTYSANPKKFNNIKYGNAYLAKHIIVDVESDTLFGLLIEDGVVVGGGLVVAKSCQPFRVSIYFILRRWVKGFKKISLRPELNCL